MPGPKFRLADSYTLTLTGIEWLSLHGNASLGLRHPQNIGASRVQAEHALEKIITLLENTGCLTPAESREARREQEMHSRRPPNQTEP